MASSTVNYFNIEYLLTRTFEGLGGAAWADLWHTLPSWFHFIIAQIGIWGMVVTLILLLMIVYTQIRLVMVEHEGFHGKEEHQVHEVEVAAPPPREERWRHVISLATSGSESDWRRAVLEADIMLSAVLAQAGYEAASVGEQLKMANPFQMTTLDLAWKAHKVRNQVAHSGEGYNLSERDMRMAIDYYRRVFEEFGAI